MTPDIVIDAMMQAVRKRRILGRVPSERLGDMARQKQIASIEDLRKWIDTGDGLSGHLANQLKALLPKPDEPSFGGYLPLAHLADGGMGSVWLACSPKDELVVVKTLKNNLAVAPGSTQAQEFIKRFEREARITQQLTHPGVVRCIDAGARTDGTLYMVLEYVDSGDLKDLVESRGGLSEGLALAIFYQVVDGLAEAHRIHLIHRDIKPANIFVSSDGRAKLADFGIARSTEQNRTMLTMEGAIVGSPLYMSPEQIVSDPNMDIRSDIYALGAVLYFTLAAQPPYDGRVQEVLHKHCTASIPDVRVLRPKISQRTHEIIHTCLQKERARRYKDPAELLAATANALVKLGLTPGAAVDEDTRSGDLSDEQAGFKPDVPTMTVNLGSDGATIAADLSGKPGAFDAHTIVANLLAEQVPAGVGPQDAPPGADTAATMAMSLNERSSEATAATMLKPAPSKPVDDATAATMAGVGTPGLGFEGNYAAAMACEWVTLSPAASGDPAQVMLYAKRKLQLGKLREAPVDLPLRNYPVAVHKDACQRVSRQHLALAYDGILDGAALEDLGGANGTMLDGMVIKAGKPHPLEAGMQSILVVAGVVTLWVKPIRRASPVIATLPGAPMAGGNAVCGLECAHGIDAVVMTRPENRPEAAYAMVLRRLTIGGPGSELPLAGARTHAAIEVGLYGGRWLWRVAGKAAPWRPLAEGTEVDCGGRTLIARPGAYPAFD